MDLSCKVGKITELKNFGLPLAIVPQCSDDILMLDGGKRVGVAQTKRHELIRASLDSSLVGSQHRLIITKKDSSP